jgi:hypothetical protein
MFNARIAKSRFILLLTAQPITRLEWVIPPFLMGLSRRIYAAVFSFMAGVMPPIAMLGRSLL